MVKIEPGSDSDWLRITVDAPFEGTRTVLSRARLVDHFRFEDGTDKTTTLLWPAKGILNHVIKTLIRCEEVAKKCYYFKDTNGCINCAGKEDCLKKLAGIR